MNFHSLFLDYFEKEGYFQDGLDKPYTKNTFLKYIFSNYSKDKSGSHKGYRLTNEGLSLLTTMFAYTEIPMPELYRVRSKDLLLLARYETNPYYIDNSKFVTFSDDSAVILKMQDEDFKKYMKFINFSKKI